MDRSKMISQLEDPSEVFDFLVIGPATRTLPALMRTN